MNGSHSCHSCQPRPRFTVIQFWTLTPSLNSVVTGGWVHQRYLMLSACGYAWDSRLPTTRVPDWSGIGEWPLYIHDWHYRLQNMAFPPCCVAVCCLSGALRRPINTLHAWLADREITELVVSPVLKGLFVWRCIWLNFAFCFTDDASCSGTGWPFSLFKTSRWHWFEICFLVKEPYTKTQLSNQCQQEVMNKLNGHPVQ